VKFFVEGSVPESKDSLPRLRLLEDLDSFFLDLVFFFLFFRSFEDSKLELLEELGLLSTDKEEWEEALGGER
jgi:hypothetical protein